MSKEWEADFERECKGEILLVLPFFTSVKVMSARPNASRNGGLPDLFSNLNSSKRARGNKSSFLFLSVDSLHMGFALQLKETISKFKIFLVECEVNLL